MKRLLALFLILYTSLSYTQEMKFTGVVNDTLNNKPMENAVIMAVRLSDGLLLGYTRSEADGSYNLRGVPIDTMELIVSHHDFDEKRFYIIGSEENNEIHIPNIIIPGQATLLDEVVVYANKEPIYFRGDTLVYVADSFATKQNAMVEDLLKNLPGLQVDDDGNISSQGRKVTKALVDGDEFFGSDPTIATRNLEAAGVAKIEVYETEDETSGGNSEDKIQVLDVKLKDNAKNGFFGKVAGNGGLNSEFLRDLPNGSGFYEGEILVNYFNKDLKVSVFGLGSNTPNTGFSKRDASRFGLTNEMSGGWGSIVNTSQLNGLPENYKGGFYFSNKLTEKIKLGINYTYNDSRLATEQVRNLEYFFVDTAYSKRDSSYMNQSQQSHTVNVDFEYDINDKTKLKLKSNLILNNESISENNASNFFTSKDQRFSETNVRNETEADGLEGNVDLELNKKFKKRFRELDVVYQLGYSEADRNNSLNSDMYFGQFNTPDSIYDQKRNRANNTTGHRLVVDYMEPITRRFRLKFQYRLDYFYGEQSTSTFNRTETGYDDFSALYSNDFTNDRFENRGAVGIFYSDRKHTLEVGSRIRNVRINNTDNETKENVLQDVDNILPYLEYSYKFSNAQRLRFVYTTSSDQPSLDQLQPVRDNTDPNFIVTGNPNLQPNYTHNLTVNYNKWNALKQRFIYSGAYFNYTDNAFSNSIVYLPSGQSVSNAINVDGNIYGGFYAGGGIPIYKKLVSLRPRTSGSYSSFNTQINNQMNTTENYNFDGSLGLEMRTDSIELSLSATISYNDPRSTLSSNLNEPYTVQRYKASVFYELPFRFFVETDAVYEINSQRAEGFNATPFIWNAKLSKRFLETGNLVINASIYDIFNQNIGISRNVGTNIITDTRSRIIARYFMIGATLRFNNNKTKADEGGNKWF